MIFVNGQTTTVKSKSKPPLKYTAGKLTALGLEDAGYIDSEISLYIRNRWKWDDKAGDFALNSRKSQRELRLTSWLLRGYGLRILVADVSQELDCDTLIKWADQDMAFVGECYKAVVRLNPSLDMDRTGMGVIVAQPETRNEQGEPISEEEAELKN